MRRKCPHFSGTPRILGTGPASRWHDPHLCEQADVVGGVAHAGQARRLEVGDIGRCEHARRAEARVVQNVVNAALRAEARDWLRGELALGVGCVRGSGGGMRPLARLPPRQGQGRTLISSAPRRFQLVQSPSEAEVGST